MLKKKNNIHPILRFKKHFPKIYHDVQFKPNSLVIGNAIINAGTQILENVIIRGDGKKIDIGKECIINKRTTIHVASDFLGTTLGNNCYIGEYCVIHACYLGNNVLVGDNSVIMDGSEIGNNSIIDANTLIPPGKKFDDYSLISGSPARLIKKLNNKYFKKFNKQNLKSNNSFLNHIFSSNYRNKNINVNGKDIFLSKDLNISCKISASSNSSIWYSTILHSPNNKGYVFLGEGSNIQDNSIINTYGHKVEIGKRVTIGHNVIINGKTLIYDDAVIGMGSFLEKNCVIEKGAFVGAKSYLKENTTVPQGQIYAGNPAIFFRNVTKKEKNYFSMGQKIYEKLAREYKKISKNYNYQKEYSTKADQ